MLSSCISALEAPPASPSSPIGSSVPDLPTGDHFTSPLTAQRQLNLPSWSPAEYRLYDSFPDTILVPKTLISAQLHTRCCRVDPAGTTVLDRPGLSLVLNVSSATLRQVFSERGFLNQYHAPFPVNTLCFVGPQLQPSSHLLDRIPAQTTRFAPTRDTAARLGAVLE